MPSILETPPDRDAYACVDVLPNALVLRGHDTCMSLTLRFATPDGGPATPPLPLHALVPWAAAGGEGEGKLRRQQGEQRLGGRGGTCGGEAREGNGGAEGRQSMADQAEGAVALAAAVRA